MALVQLGQSYSPQEMVVALGWHSDGRFGNNDEVEKIKCDDYILCHVPPLTMQF